MLLTETKTGVAAATTSTRHYLCASWGTLHQLLAGQDVLGKWPKTKGKEVLDREALRASIYVIH